MKILFIVPYVPNLVRVRSYNLLHTLARRGHTLTLATLWIDAKEKQELDALRPACAEIVARPMPRWLSLLNSAAALPTRMPLQSVYSWLPGLEKQLAQRLDGGHNGARYDMIHVEHLRGARYGEALLRRVQQMGKPIPVVWDSVDCISLLFRYTAQNNRRLFNRLISNLELGRTARYEARLVRSFDHTVITSPKDRDGILALDGGSPAEKVSVISHGVDLDYYHPDESQPRHPASLVLSGKMSYHANVAMAQYLLNEIMPLLWAQRPELELVIVGKDPPASIQEFAAHPNVKVTGTVPDLRPYLQRATLAVAPLRYAVGVQNKVLEAMACATAVVTTPQVLSSISARPGEDIMIAEDAPGFAQAVLALLNDPKRRLAMQKSARRYVEENHSWDVVTCRLEQVYQSAIEQKRKI